MKRENRQWADRVDEGKFRARFGRFPLEAELGCAAAHVEAYAALTEEQFDWALVLEDDAVISNQDELRTLVEEITLNCEVRGNVISLYSGGPVFASGTRPLCGLGALELKIPAHGAVAYLVDRVAAVNLQQAQSPLASVSDWPSVLDAVDFLYIPNKVITHAANNVESTIADGVDRSKMVPFRVRFLMWTGLWFLMHRSQFISAGAYYVEVIRPRIATHFWRRAVLDD